jgi:putative (di)nucleoside polyphosphate hydrolase
VIDSSGYRPNVGIILSNYNGQLFFAKRIGREAWQFPQGGVHDDESLEEALFRELKEEIGLDGNDVTILGRTRHWLRYRIPKRLIRDTRPYCIGQKQLWYLLRLETDETAIHLATTEKPEFDAWQWVSYWYPLRQVVVFKREVYRRALRELAPYLYKSATNGLGHRPLDSLLQGLGPDKVGVKRSEKIKTSNNYNN